MVRTIRKIGAWICVPEGLYMCGPIIPYCRLQICRMVVISVVECAILQIILNDAIHNFTYKLWQWSHRKKRRKSERTTGNETDKTKIEGSTCILLSRLNYSGVILHLYLVLKNEKTCLESPWPCSTLWDYATNEIGKDRRKYRE